MTEKDLESIVKEYIKMNLVVEFTHNPWGHAQVQLRFVTETKPFAEARIIHS